MLPPAPSSTPAALRLAALLLGLLLVLAGARILGLPALRSASARPARASAGLHPSEPLELVESWPVETEMDHPDIADAADVWLAMMRGARKSIDIAEFYVTSREGSRMEPVLQAIRKAARRGVRVRILADAKFYGIYPEVLDELAARKGIELRVYDVGKLMGGVLHAKYFVVDGEVAYLGSQNFDWRSLEHIQELGVRFDDPKLVAAVQDVFEADWAWAGGAPASQRPEARVHASDFPVTLQLAQGSVQVTPVASPTGFLPDEELWDLPRLVQLIDSAEETVRVQLLNYQTTDYQGRYFAELEDALRRAAARRVKVQILVSDWSKRKWTVEGLQSLQALPRIEVKFLSVPQWSGGFIDHARVIHAKYLVVDGQRAWIGTGNWARGYFHDSRNLGLVVEGAAFASRLDRFFLDDWNGPYVEDVDPCAHYEPPKISED